MESEPSNEELMLRYGDGDATAFEALYRRHRGPLYRFLLRQVANASTAEELFQDVWMRVVNSRTRYEARAKFTSWMYTIAHNRLMDFYRANGRAMFLDGEESEAALERAPAEDIAADQDVRALRESLKQAQQRINQLHDRLEATLKQCLRVAASQAGGGVAGSDTAADPAPRANLLLCYVMGRWQQFAKSGFKRVPTEHWDKQWPLLAR